MKTIYKWIRRPLVLVLLVLLILFLFQRLNLFGIGKWFSSKPVVIDNTPMVITKIKAIAELNTMSMYQEVVVDSVAITTSSMPIMINPFSFDPRPGVTKKEIVLIVKGRVTAGIDLNSLSEKDVVIVGDSVSIKMPAAAITEVFLNPSDIETFYEKGSWSNEEVTAVKQSARQKLLAEANRQQLVKKAQDRGKKVLEQFLKTARFKRIDVH